MANCNFNARNTGPYYPCQISSCCCNRSCSKTGNIVNPEILSNWFYAILEEETTVNSAENIPIQLQLLNGKAIQQKSIGVFLLTAGVYSISYNTNAKIASETQEVQVALFDGISQISTSLGVAGGSVNAVRTISKQVIFKIENSAFLSLKNLTEGAINFSNSNLTIQKIEN